MRLEATLSAESMLKQEDMQETPPTSKLRDRGDALAPASLSKA